MMMEEITDMEIEALLEALLPEAQNSPADVIRANEEMIFHLDEYQPRLSPLSCSYH